jgi:kinesin family protein 6/9
VFFETRSGETAKRFVKSVLIFQTMIATAAIDDPLIDESIATCRFAQRVALISNKAELNEEVDPQLVIARLKKEIERLKAELAIARGDTSDSTDELPEYEIERYCQS